MSQIVRDVSGCTLSIGILLFVVGLTAAVAQSVQVSDLGRVTRPASPKAKEIQLYDDAKGTRPKSGMTAVAGIPFPLAILAVDENGDFLKVRVRGEEVWVDGAEVIIDRPVAAKCRERTDLGQKPTGIAATKGAGANCR